MSLARIIFLLFSFVCVLGVIGEIQAAENARTVLFFGDSLTAGHGLSAPGEDAYPAQIQKKIESEGLSWRVVNAGLSGETSAGGLRRIDWILRQPVDVFVLALGANDGLRGVSPAVTRENLERIFDRVLAKYPKARLVLAGMQMPPAMGMEYTREFQEVYPAVAEKYKAALIPFLLENVGGVPKFNQGDRIHPNVAGHALLADNVWKTLRPLL